MTEPEAYAFLNHVDHTAGLFSGNGGIDAKAQTYSFPHRQFQEYLAGCFLAFPQPDDEESKELYQKKLALADYWEEAAHLGADYQLYDTDHVNGVGYCGQLILHSTIKPRSKMTLLVFVTPPVRVARRILSACGEICSPSCGSANCRPKNALRLGGHWPSWVTRAAR